MTHTIVIEQAIARMLIYRFLEQGFSYPETGFTDILLNNSVWDELTVADQELVAGAGKTVAGMRDFLRQYNGDSQKLLTDLQIEYTYLFINAIPHVPAPPYESVYFGEGLLMGPPVSSVVNLYREAGLIISPSYEALPDHIGAELEFMFYLIQQETKARQTDEPETADTWLIKQSVFLSEHLLQWSSQFIARIRASARTPFYLLLAELSEAFLKTEQKITGLKELKLIEKEG